MNLETFSRLLTIMIGPKHQNFRRGQHMFNVLSDNFPAIAKRIRGTQYDPFTVDLRIPKFITYLTEFITYD